MMPNNPNANYEIFVALAQHLAHDIYDDDTLHHLEPNETYSAVQVRYMKSFTVPTDQLKPLLEATRPWLKPHADYVCLTP